MPKSIPTIARSAVVSLVLALSACVVFAQGGSSPGTTLRAAAYDGKWTGEVNCLHDPGLWPEDECGIRFTFDIQGPRILVDQVVRSKSGKETKSTINAGKFGFARLSTNAVAVSMDSGKDEDGTWVETWSFTMTLIDSNHMLVHWTRVVNNIDMPREKKGSKFSSVGMGEFARVGSGT